MSNTTNTNKKTKKTGLQWEHLVAGEWQREALTYGSGADAYYHDRCKSPDWRLLRIDPTGDETVVHHHGLIDDWNL